MKKWISTIVLALLAAYIVVGAIAFSRKPADQVCQGVKLEIADSTEVGYMNTNDVLSLLRKSGLDPTGKLMEEVNLRAIEKALDAERYGIRIRIQATSGGILPTVVQTQ